jgi:exopolysaccharide biosynthesis polyprenyl glycosylphosphotransferase
MSRTAEQVDRESSELWAASVAALDTYPLQAAPNTLSLVKPVDEQFANAPRFSQLHRPVLALAVKRLFDVVGASIGILLLSPVMLAIALLIKLTSPGPVLFVQRRAGLRGKPFGCFKFRTMRPTAEAEKQQLMKLNELSGPAFKIKDDPRVTPIGKVLRETSLDELPQFFNVLLGQMSLVGPRPPSLDEVSRYKPHHLRRLSVVPGISGLWQVSGRSSIADFEKWVALDLEYIDSWSLRLDVEILLRTVPAVVFRKGAS